ncbi:MAG: NAD(P)/FAD-dependent oxidoreductase, partial [Acidobacteria bacterium]|nr:NAD(P)/FAD-dependent oxidoreductase [Acidobacteriota bacterium]
FPPETLGTAISDVTLYSPKLRSFDMTSEKAEFRVGKMGVLYNALLNDCLELGVEFLNGTRYAGIVDFSSGNGSDRIGDRVIVRLEKQGSVIEVQTKVLIGADGARSRVAKDLHLDENTEWIVGYEEVFKGVPLTGDPRLHCFLDAKLAPGYLAWITNDGEESHIGVGGYPSKFDPRKALREFKQEVAANFVDLENAELAETRGGRIPVGGVLRRIANENGLLIGDAAGAVSPLTAGGLDPCLRLSKFAAEIVLKRLKTGDAKELQNYSGEMFRAKFTTRLMMRYVLKTFSYQAFLEAAFFFLRGKFGRKVAEKIFFRRGSFPDIEIANPTVAGNETKVSVY